ncbi:MAG: YbjQ family protein, partial [Gemmatimonadota bacterium]|nr:YbjQ family protein [Gemmatimonadota bacterium]
DICPGAEEGTGALWGGVTDSDADMVLPGASVIASWDVDGETRRAEAQVGVDGAYTICYLPLELPITVHAAFATMEGVPIQVAMTEVFTRQDLSLSMSGSAAAEDDDDRLWLCVAGGQSTINIQNSRLIRCDPQWQPLERCPKEELGGISVQPAGGGSGMMREMIEGVVQEAKRLGANAVINVQDSRTSITGEAVRIDVDPSTC